LQLNLLHCTTQQQVANYYRRQHLFLPYQRWRLCSRQNPAHQTEQYQSTLRRLLPCQLRWPKHQPPFAQRLPHQSQLAHRQGQEPHQFCYRFRPYYPLDMRRSDFRSWQS
jgi:hypothetical protein